MEVVRTGTDASRLLTAVYDNPHDHDLKLVLADALIDAGDEERAEAWRALAEGKYSPHITKRSNVFYWNYEGLNDDYPDILTHSRLPDPWNCHLKGDNCPISEYRRKHKPYCKSYSNARDAWTEVVEAFVRWKRDERRAAAEGERS